ncbi:hypothetical protein TIFTF001_023846 [Ficus carica]|uniref:Uncharacterized protein n=1 Tax=Ficus carica TaxID=3494 RepID=A0AA88DE72_FICCA|nr:hypothetical protein TIFTF001_023846 [Ficus carica]
MEAKLLGASVPSTGPLHSASNPRPTSLFSFRTRQSLNLVNFKSSLPHHQDFWPTDSAVTGCDHQLVGILVDTNRYYSGY